MKEFSRSMISAALALAATTMFFTPLRAYAQQPGSDDLSAFEADLFSSESAIALEASPDAVRTEYLVGGTVVANAGASFTSALDELAALSTVSGKLFAKVSVPDYGALYIAYNARHSLFQSYSGSGTAPAASNPYVPTYNLAELHYSFDLAKVLFVRLGNQLIAWGPSRIWSPVDFINLEKADAFASLDARVGKPGLRLHLPLPRANAFMFADFGNLISESGTSSTGWTSGDPVETINLGGRFDFTSGPFEFGVTGYGGKNTQLRFGTDASGRLLGTTVYGEFALKPGYDDYAYSAQASLGFSRSLGELKLWTLSGEGFYNSAGQDLGGYSVTDLVLAVNSASLASDATRALYQGEFYAYAALSAAELFSPSLSTSFSGIVNLSDGSYRLTLSESFSFPRAVPFTLSVTYAGGGADKEFTRYAGDQALSVQLSTRVEF